jgi:hypothetical protein
MELTQHPRFDNEGQHEYGDDLRRNCEEFRLRPEFLADDDKCCKKTPR